MIRDVGSILKVGGTWIEGTLGNFLDVANGCLGKVRLVVFTCRPPWLGDGENFVTKVLWDP